MLNSVEITKKTVKFIFTKKTVKFINSYQVLFSQRQMKILQYYQQKYIFTKTKVKYDTFFGQKIKNNTY